MLKPKFEDLLMSKHQHNIEFQLVTQNGETKAGVGTQLHSKQMSDRSSKIMKLASPSKNSKMNLNESQSQNQPHYDSLYRKQAPIPSQSQGTGAQTVARTSFPNVNQDLHFDMNNTSDEESRAGGNNLPAMQSLDMGDLNQDSKDQAAEFYIYEHNAIDSNESIKRRSVNIAAWEIKNSKHGEIPTLYSNSKDPISPQK